LDGTSGDAGSSGTSGTSGTGFNTINNYSNNRILTSNNTTNSADAETNLTFDGSLLTVTGNLLVTGSFSILGSSSTINTTNLAVADSIIVLSHSQSGPLLDSGIFIDRGPTDATQSFYWDETSDVWTFASTNTNHETGGPINVITHSNIKAADATLNKLKLLNGAQDGYILISDAIGNASWTASIPGTSGTSGSSGSSGTSGSSGSSGTSGSSGSSGTSGTSGTSAILPVGTELVYGELYANSSFSVNLGTGTGLQSWATVSSANLLQGDLSSDVTYNGTNTLTISSKSNTVYYRFITTIGCFKGEASPNGLDIGLSIDGATPSTDLTTTIASGDFSGNFQRVIRIRNFFTKRW